MKWNVRLGSEGVYWWEAKTPVGDLVVEYPDPMKVADWEARWYPHRDSEGVLLCTGKTAEAAQIAIVKEMRRRAVRWARAFK